MSYDVKSAVGWITAIAVVFSIASYILSLIVSATLGLSDPVTTQLQSLTQPAIIWAFMLGAEIPANAFLIFTGCLVVYAICFVKAARANNGLLSGLRALATGAPPKDLRNWLSVMPLLASGLLPIVLLLTYLENTLGVQTGGLPPTPPASLLTELALAPIAEEVGFRITVLGLVIGILLAWKFGKEIASGVKTTTAHEISLFVVGFFSPGYAKEKLGLPSIRTHGWKGISIPEWIFLAITSTVFGAYHILGGGWGPGKFLTAAIQGFALGIVYLAYGAYANIMLHWFFDLNFYVFDPTVVSNGALNIFGILYEFGAIALGIWSIILTVYWIVTARTRSSPTVPASYPGIHY